MSICNPKYALFRIMSKAFQTELTMKEALLRYHKVDDTDTEITSLSQAMLDEHIATIAMLIHTSKTITYGFWSIASASVIGLT